MKNKEMKVKAMSMAVAMSMVVGLCPSTIFAAENTQAVKDVFILRQPTWQEQQRMTKMKTNGMSMTLKSA